MKGTNRWMIGLLVISGLMSCSNKDESKNEPQIEEVRNKNSQGRITILDD